MNLKRVGRLFVCLVLVAALFVQLSPIRARAAGPNFFFVDPELQLASDLVGLGVSTGADSLAHTQVIQDAADWLAETGEWLTDGMLKVYKVAADAGGFKYMVDGDFLQELFEWMFDAEVVISNAPYVGTSFEYSYDGTYQTCSASVPVAIYGCNYHITTATQSYTNFQVFAVADTSGYFYKNKNYTSSYSVLSKVTSGAYVAAFASGTNALNSSKFSNVTLLEFSGSSYSECQEQFYASAGISTGEITTDKDLTLNHVGAFGSILPDSYPEWFQNSTTITDSETGEEKTVVPIGLGQTVGETQGMSQTDVWAGTSTYVDTETDVGTGDDTIAVPETVTLKDILTGILSVPKSIAEAVAGFFADVITAVQAIPAAIADVLTAIFVPSADYVTAKVDALRTKFPFIDSVITTGEFIRDSVSGASGPPAIYVDLSLASSGNYGSQKVLLTDFGWYAQYKPKVDTILSAALWAFFGWRVFLKLPGIISGESGYIGEAIAPREKTARDETIRKIMSGPPSKK